VADADAVVQAVEARADPQPLAHAPEDSRRLACCRLSLSCVMATMATNCPGATPISCASSTSRLSRSRSSSRWLRLSLHIVICRCEWCSACRLHHQLKVLAAVHPVVDEVEHQQVDARSSATAGR
jgi:hypothetical protein